MNTSHSRAPNNEQILEEACDWFIDCNDGELDPAGRERFDRWLRQSPQHVQAYLEIAATWENSARLPSGEPEKSKRKKLPWLVLAAAASVIVALGVSFMSRQNTYTTGVGEFQSITLTDGSKITLDTRSRLRVRFSRSERLVELAYGQAFFQVAKDAMRPFTVLSGGTQVRDIGTQFDVYRKTTGTTITVVEGRVAVAGDPLPVAAGEQLIITPTATPQVVHIDVAAAIAWTRHKLVFNETPLSEAIAEFNRYNSRQIVIEDASLGDYHIRGSFDANDPSRLLEFLRDRFQAGVRDEGNETHISRH